MNGLAMLNPWQEMRRLQSEMEQLFGDTTAGWRWPLTGVYPPLKVSRNEDGIRVEALCPGVDRDSLDMTVVGDAVTISGERKPEPDVPAERYHRRERPVGAFTRTVSLGERLDPDRAQATYANGILRVQLARAAETRPRKIEIQK